MHDALKQGSSSRDTRALPDLAAFVVGCELVLRCRWLERMDPTPTSLIARIAKKGDLGIRKTFASGDVSRHRDHDRACGNPSSILGLVTMIQKVSVLPHLRQENLLAGDEPIVVRSDLDQLWSAGRP